MVRPTRQNMLAEAEMQREQVYDEAQFDTKTRDTWEYLITTAFGLEKTDIRRALSIYLEADGAEVSRTIYSTRRHLQHTIEKHIPKASTYFFSSAA